MFKFIFKIRNRRGSKEEFLAPETRPIIYFNRSELLTKNDETDVPTFNINYRLINEKKQVRV